eukprot:g14034.t1
MLRECRYNLGEAEEEDEGLSKVTQSGKSTKDRAMQLINFFADTDGGMTYRGHAVSIPSEKIKAKVKICLESAKAVQADADSENRGPASTEKYGEISIEFGEAFIREASLCLSVERNLMLLKSHLTKLDDTEDVNTIDSRRYCRPEEGMRFCELIKEDLAALAQLPESSPDLEDRLAVYKKAVLDYRCMYLALCHTALGKLLEAAALLDMLTGRIEEAVGSGGPGHLPRLESLFHHIQQQLPLRVARWHCRVLVLLAKSKKTKKDDAEAMFAANIPCKPLLFDLAFPCIEPPDLDEILPKKQEGKGRQAVAAVAGALGGLGSRLGGWMELMPFRAGDTVGAYAVDRLLGRGAYGEVFLVHGQVQYAMKVIPCDLGPKQAHRIAK